MIAAFNAGAGILGFPVGGWLSDVAVRRGLGRKPLLIGFTGAQLVLTLIFGFVVAAGGANIWLIAALLFNAMQPIAHAILAEIGAVLSPAVSCALRDATGGWSAAVFVDAGLIAGAILLFLFVRESARMSGAEPAGRFRRAPSEATVSSSTG